MSAMFYAGHISRLPVNTLNELNVLLDEFHWALVVIIYGP